MANILKVHGHFAKKTWKEIWDCCHNRQSGKVGASLRGKHCAYQNVVDAGLRSQEYTVKNKKYPTIHRWSTLGEFIDLANDKSTCGNHLDLLSFWLPIPGIIWYAQ